MGHRGLKRFTRQVLLSFFSFIILSGCQEQKPIYTPGTYVNEAEGYYSTLKVQISVDEYYIKEILILEHEEPTILSDIVFEQLPPRIIKQNSTDIDGISGASYTSKALLDAVHQALLQAKEGN